MKYLVLLLLLINSSCHASFDATIPVIDMNDYYSKSRHKVFIRGLKDAMQTVGFVAVLNSRVDKQILDNAYEAAKVFYAQPLSFKLRGNDPKLNGQRGYVQSETAKGQAKKDYKEFYHIARDYPAEINHKFGYPANIWPAEDGFKPAMQQLIVALDKYVEVIEAALAESIGEKPEYFSEMTRHGTYLLRSIHYPANPPADSVWASAHTDIDLFTILPRATADGLQLLNSKGEWIDVVVPDNAFIINAGDMLQNITNGVYKSAKHRVISTRQNIERYSMVAFIHPRPTDKMDPLAKFIKQVGSQKYANLSQQAMLSERLIDLGLDSPELLQEFAKSGAIERLIAVKRASPTAMRALRAAKLASPIVLAELDKIEHN